MATPLYDPPPTLTLVPPPAEAPVFKDESATRKPSASVRSIAKTTNRVAQLALLPHTLRGYRQLGRRWLTKFHDDYPQMIASTDQAIRDAAGDVGQEARLQDRRAELRAEYKRHRLTFTGKTAGVAGAVAGGVGFGAVTGSLWLDALAGISAWGLGANGAGSAGRRVVRVSEGTPDGSRGAIIAKAGEGLETRFDLATNGVRPQPMVERRACAILRLVSGDPFATAPAMPYRAPKSNVDHRPVPVGTSVGGDPLDLSLAGVMGLWVAASGGGKTGILQALAEGTTACYDNITIDLDPHGDGLEDLHDAVRITARTHEQIEATLLFFLVMSKARARLRAKLGMGKKWIASPSTPP
jgi:hypothetical protein